MSSGITFSGFNSIDFNVVINALMTQAAEPLTNLQHRQTALKSQLSTFTQLSAKVAAVQTAAEALSSTSTLSTFSSTLSDSSVLSAVTTTDSAPGHYDIVVSELARAQVTATATTSPDANTTTVADGGSLTINGKTVTLTGAVTLQGLAKAINDTSGIEARASVVQTGEGAFRLVLTGVSTGAANSFTVQNALTGGTGLGFTDTDGDGLSGNSAADNAVQATNASLLVNNLAISSASNTVTSAVPGTTLTLLKKSPGTIVSMDVAPDSSALQGKVEAFVTAYNALQKFASDQSLSAASGNSSSIARDPLLRSLKSALRNTLTSAYGAGASATDAANLVLGRAYLERFRQSSDRADLVAARDALREVRPTTLGSREQAEYLVGLGELLYLDEAYGSAAEIFVTAFDRSRDLGPRAFDRVFDWWATSLDQQAQSGLIEDRDALYGEILFRAQAALTQMPGLASPAYWLVVATRSLGDTVRAWDAAVAAWVRAPLAEDNGVALRADLDRLVLQAIIPERVRQLATTDSERERQATRLRLDWETVKKDWSGR